MKQENQTALCLLLIYELEAGGWGFKTGFGIRILGLEECLSSDPAFHPSIPYYPDHPFRFFLHFFSFLAVGDIKYTIEWHRDFRRLGGYWQG